MRHVLFRPVWLTTRASDLSNDDLGAFLRWLRVNMGAMPEVERERAKLVQRRLFAEQKSRRAQSRQCP